MQISINALFEKFSKDKRTLTLNDISEIFKFVVKIDLTNDEITLIKKTL